jgi:hypothetical protein
VTLLRVAEATALVELGLGHSFEMQETRQSWLHRDWLLTSVKEHSKKDDREITFARLAARTQTNKKPVVACVLNEVFHPHTACSASRQKCDVDAKHTHTTTQICECHIGYVLVILLFQLHLY